MPSLRPIGRSWLELRRIVTGLTLTTALVSIGTTACTSEATTPRMRVARDLGCTAEQTSVEKLGGGRWQVTGCGRSAVYLCTTPVRDCWREETAPNASAELSQTSP